MRAVERIGPDKALGESVLLNQVYTQQGQVSGHQNIQDVFQNMRSPKKKQQKNHLRASKVRGREGGLPRFGQCPKFNQF